jgi:hypothetical protein
MPAKKSKRNDTEVCTLATIRHSFNGDDYTASFTVTTHVVSVESRGMNGK